MQGMTRGTQNDLIGHVVQHHEVIRLLGQGGMGAVYVARHQTLGSLRALKIIHDDIKAQPTMAERFKREALALARLQHPSIVSVVDYGQLDNGWPYLMLEFVAGADLSKILHKHGPLSLPAALVILAQLARTIEFTHSQGIVHRDLKPGNVLLGKNDPRQVKVIDFGLVRLLSAEMLTRLTADRQVMGSPQYMAPEQARGSGEITGAADVYAVAGMAYALLSGKSVFGRRPPLALIYAQARESPERLSSRVTIPDRLDDLLYSSLAKNPAKRPTAAVMAGELEHLLADMGGCPADLAPLAPADARDPSEPGDEESPTNVMGNELASVAGSIAGGHVSGHDRASSVPEVILSNSMARSVDVASAADIIFAPLPQSGDRRVREALQRQMLAVVGELAEILASRDHEIATLRTRIREIEDRLGDLEMDAALLDADLAGASEEQRVELARRKAEIAARLNQMRTSVDAEQRALTVFVDHRRSSAPPETSALYDELDQMVERALSLPSAAEEPRNDS
jgi:serine/threonine protein kinase